MRLYLNIVVELMKRHGISGRYTKSVYRYLIQIIREKRIMILDTVSRYCIRILLPYFTF